MTGYGIEYFGGLTFPFFVHEIVVISFGFNAAKQVKFAVLPVHPSPTWTSIPLSECLHYVQYRIKYAIYPSKMIRRSRRAFVIESARSK